MIHIFSLTIMHHFFAKMWVVTEGKPSRILKWTLEFCVTPQTKTKIRLGVYNYVMKFITKYCNCMSRVNSNNIKVWWFYKPTHQILFYFLYSWLIYILNYTSSWLQVTHNWFWRAEAIHSLQATLHHAIFDTMQHYGSSHTLWKIGLKVSFQKVHNEHQHILGVKLELSTKHKVKNDVSYASHSMSRLVINHSFAKKKAN
jgi:hypothetical protein